MEWIRNVHIRTYGILLFLCAGTLIGLSFITQSLWWCALPGTVIFFLAIEQSHSLRIVIFGSFLAGFIKAGMTVVWLFDAYPADWLGGATRLQQLIVIGGCWFGTAISIALGYLFIGICIYHVQNLTLKIRPFVYAVLFVLGEVIGSIAFSLYTFGTGGSVNAYFGFSQVGFTLAQHGTLKYVAILAGVYGLSFILALLAILSLLYVQKQNSFSKKIILGVVITAFYIGSSYVSLPSEQKTETLVAAVSTRFPSYASMTEDELLRRQRDLQSGIEVALVSGAEIVVLPEDARYGYEKPEERILASLATIPHAENAVVVDSFRTDISSSSVVIRGYLYDIDAQKTYITDKQYVVPMGEYLPYLHGKVVGFLDGSFFFDAMRYVEGTKELSPETLTHVPNVLFCFESGAPYIAKRKSMTRKSMLTAHPVSHGWFHNPRTLWKQERQMLIVQALYSKTPILQAGNNAPSELYTADGEVVQGEVVDEGARYRTLMFKI